MGRLIDADVLREEVYSWGMNDYEPSDFTDAIDTASTVEAIPIPEGATNGDIIKAMFPNVKMYEQTPTMTYYGMMRFDTDWWNSPYKENEDATN